MTFPLRNFVLSLVVGLVILVIMFMVMALVFPEYFGKTKAQEEAPSIMRMEKASVTFPNPRNVNGAWEYNVYMQGEVVYQGDLKIRDVPVNFIRAFALISFKGEDKRAMVVTDIGDEPTFIIDENNKRLLREFRTTVVSTTPPLQDVLNPYNGMMKKHQSFHLTAIGNYVVTLKNIKSPNTYRILNPANPDCVIEFDVSCPKTSYAITIVDGECNQGSKPSCQDEAKICDGNLFIKVYDSNCAQGFVDSLLIRASGGQKMEIGDSADISFWVDDQCTKDKHTFQELRSICGGSYLGGPYSIKGERIPFI